MRCVAAWVIGMLAMLASPHATAAWPQKKAGWLIISTLSNYQAKARFDAFGLRVESAGYSRQELSVYGVYGVTDALTLGAQPSFTRLNAQAGIYTGRETRTGLSHIEMLARHKITDGENWVLSGQGLVKLPGANAAGREPLIKESGRDFEARLLFGRSGTLFERAYFSVAETGFRARGNGAADQLRADVTFGIRPWPRWQVIAQNFSTLSASRSVISGPGDFDLYKAQASVLRDLPRGLSVQLGGYAEYAGRNTGAGNALFVALWSRF